MAPFRLLSHTACANTFKTLQSIQFFEEGRLATALSYGSTASLPGSAPADVTAIGSSDFISGMSYTYDEYNRVLSITDSRIGTATMGINIAKLSGQALVIMRLRTMN